MLEEAGHGLTSMAMNTARTHGDENLLVRFYKKAKHIMYKTREMGRPIYEERDYVEILQPGNKENITRRPVTEMDKRRFAEKYKRFLAMEEQEGFEGTPLEEWPAVNRAQVEELKYLNIRTVEQLASVSDANAQNVMGIQMLKQKAKNYLEASKDEATAEALALAQSQIAMLTSRLDELGTENRVLKDVSEPKKRGRPKKEPVEE